MKPIALQRDESGAVLVEISILLPIVITILFGSIDFLYAFYQWNAAAKAVQIGARIAAVSDPVAAGLNNLSLAIVSASVPPGSTMPYFKITCDGATASCTCNTVGACPGVGGYDEAAMRTLVFGRGHSSCTTPTSAYDAGMCGIFSRIRPDNVVITYTQTGL